MSFNSPDLSQLGFRVGYGTQISVTLVKGELDKVYTVFSFPSLLAVLDTVCFTNLLNCLPEWKICQEGKAEKPIELEEAGEESSRSCAAAFTNWDEPVHAHLC